MYKIIRFYSTGKSRIIKRGLSLEQAQEHCQNPKTSGIKKGVRWFDGYEKE